MRYFRNAMIQLVKLLKPYQHLWSAFCKVVSDTSKDLSIYMVMHVDQWNLFGHVTPALYHMHLQHAIGSHSLHKINYQN